MIEGMFYVYLLKSKIRDEIYIGSTKDIEKRVVEHNMGLEISTRRYKPWVLLYYEAYTLETYARMREKKLKYHGNAIRELKKRIGFVKVSAGSPSTTFAGSFVLPQNGNSGITVARSHSRVLRKSGAGFTMIELMVTIAIFALVSGIMLAKYPTFSSRIVLENTAHQIGLSVREAQTYGLSVKEFSDIANVFPTYGIHFRVSGSLDQDPASQKNFVLFADLLPTPSTPTENNDLYDGVSGCSVTGGECVEQFTIENANSIILLCGNLKDKNATVDDWQENGADCSLSSLDITFTRPNPDAHIIGNSTIVGAEGLAIFSDAEIVVRSPRGDTKMIVVWSTGQISTE